MSKGLKFKKFDLHIHTPASDDYSDKSVTALQIVENAISKGLSGIAITDHQTGAWIDSIKKEAKGKGLAVFPGVELKVHGGKSGIHLIILFDIDKDTSHVNAFLNTVKVYDKNGKPDLISNKTVIDIAKELEEYDPSAILVMAHGDSSQGVLKDMRGQQRNEIFKPEYHCLLGIEAPESDFVDPQKIKDGDRIIDLFDGGFIDFHNKKIGVYQASDAHCLNDIGSKSTYFKVDDEISIEDIRQSFIDRDTRIRQNFEYKETLYPHIDKIKITSGFLSDQEVEFHEGLNSLLGAKGSGKSLIVEFLRFVLFQPPKILEIKNDHDSKLEKCLKLHGSVEVTISDESGKKYLIKRTYNPADNFPVEIIDLFDNSKKDFEIEKLFPVLFLSQNEIIKIAEDRSGKSQREFIDRFFDFYKYQQDIKDQIKDLNEIDSKFAESLRSYISMLNVQRRISSCKEEIEKLDRQVNNKVFDKYSKQEKIGRAINNQISFIDNLKDSLNNTESEYKDIVAITTDDPIVNSDPAVKRSIESANEAVKKINSALTDAISTIEQQKIAISQEYKDWKNGFDIIKAEYDKVVIETGGTQVTLDQRRKKLTSDLSELERELAKYSGKSQLLDIRIKKRDETLLKLEKAYRSYFVQRTDRCEYFTKNSSGSLNVTIKEMEDKTAFKNNLIFFKKGSWLKDEEIEAISEKISPKDFIDNIFGYERSERNSKGFITNLSNLTGIKEENIERLLQHLLETYTYEEILALMYTSIPEDVPSINYKVDSVFKPLSELSVGQKAVALLIISLSDGNFPIVIDQPEDSLDLRSIWDDVCIKIRGNKENRQFIFTTHNSSVAVASDSDKFTILQSNSTKGEVLFSGSINQPEIKKEVINYLEGGNGTYEKKRQKYIDFRKS